MRQTPPTVGLLTYNVPSVAAVMLSGYARSPGKAISFGSAKTGGTSVKMLASVKARVCDRRN